MYSDIPFLSTTMLSNKGSDMPTVIYIHEAIHESIQQIKAEFYPLTKSKFEEIISKKDYKPTILHLICKTTYIIPNNRIRINFSI